jgi:hypothetical protein
MSSQKKFAIFVLAAVITHAGLVFANNLLLARSRIGQVDSAAADWKGGGMLVLGNSHATAVDESMFEQAFNLATYGETLHQTYYRLKWLIEEDGKVPEVVVMSFDLGLLRNPLATKNPNQFYWNRYEEWSRLAEFSQSHPPFYAHRLTAALVPYKNLDVVLFDFLADTSKPAGALRDQKGQPPPTPAREQILEGLQRELSEYGDFYFRELLKICKSNGISLFLVRFPVTEQYFSENSLDFEPSAYYAALTEILEEEYPQTTVIDLHNSFPDHEFRDPHHLKGGEPRRRMTTMLKNRMSPH